jgi:hypothetical protein
MQHRLVDDVYGWIAVQQDVPTCESVTALIREKLREGRTFFELECAFKEAAVELENLARKFRTQASGDSEARRDANTASAQARMLEEIRFRTRVGV